jgi:hypothetical protein
MLVVCDHYSKVLGRRTFRVKTWDLGAALEWADERARLAAFTTLDAEHLTLMVGRPGPTGA